MGSPRDFSTKNRNRKQGYPLQLLLLANANRPIINIRIGKKEVKPHLPVDDIIVYLLGKLKTVNRKII